MSWPHLFWAELSVFMVTVAVTLILSFYCDAPLKELANPAIPENPAKAPWYFLGIAGTGFVFRVHGRPVDPRDRAGRTGADSVPGPQHRRRRHVVRHAGRAASALAVSLAGTRRRTVGMLAFTVNYGWLRNWFPNIHQLWIIAINPGSLLVLIFAAWSLLVLKRQRLGAPGSGRTVHLFSGRLHCSDLLRDRPSRAQLASSTGGRRSGRCTRRIAMKDPSRIYRWLLLAASLVTMVYLVAAAVRENYLAEWNRCRASTAALLDQSHRRRGRELLARSSASS